jgi:hypothetical protein
MTRSKRLQLRTVVPKTKKALKSAYHRTTKRVRFFLKSAKTRVKKVPSYFDRTMSRIIRSVTRKR